MQKVMVRLDGFLRRRRWLVLGAWIALVVAAAPLAAKQSEHLTGGGFNVPGSQSNAVNDSLERFGNGASSTLGGVLVPQPGATPAQMRAAVLRLTAAVRTVPRAVIAPADRARALRATAGRPHTLVVPMRATIAPDRAQDVATDLRDALRVSDGPRAGVGTHLVGEGALYAGLQHVSKEDLASAEKVGFPVVALILLMVFGSLAAAALPLLLGLASVVITGALIFALSRQMEMSVFVTNMASMIGIGVAVDYSLFVLARYREEIRDGRTPAVARTNAMTTSGVAVVFSGATVIVSLAGLWMVPNGALRSMALGAMLVVAVSVLASATLLPVLIRAFGSRAHARNRLFTVSGLVARSWSPRRSGSTSPDGPGRVGAWERWTALVTRRPGVSVTIVSAVLLVMAIPALSMKTGTGALAQFPKDNETRVGFEAAAAVAGPASATPVDVLLDFRHGRADAPANAAATTSTRALVARDPLIGRLGPTELSRDGHAALFKAIPRVDAESAPAKRMVERLRGRLAGAPAAQRADVALGGSTARQRDVENLISGSMWKIIVFVLGFSFVVLMVLLRSLVLPLKAVVMNLLSVGAAYGVLVVVFQWGWLDPITGFDSAGHLDTLTPPLVLAVVFGLSMDYEVFLLSRIRERWQATGDTQRAVTEGLSSSARTITSAALIMASVFSVFVLTGVPSIKELGLGNAVAIVLDATLVRLILVPAAMELLGDWNWWLPRPLARILPRASAESAPEPAKSALA